MSIVSSSPSQGVRVIDNSLDSLSVLRQEFWGRAQGSGYCSVVILLTLISWSIKLYCCAKSIIWQAKPCQLVSGVLVKWYKPQGIAMSLSYWSQICRRQCAILVAEVGAPNWSAIILSSRRSWQSLKIVLTKFWPWSPKTQLVLRIIKRFSCSAIACSPANLLCP
jgi:hypothetical protein